MRTLDLFCGCGGMTLGLGNAGMSVIAAVDNDVDALFHQRLNFSHINLRANLADAGASKLLRGLYPQLVVGGPPCQDFSSVGPRKEGELANLTVNYAWIVKVLRPAFFIFENVPRAAKSRAYRKARQHFTSGGYGLTEYMLDASLCGVPQKRKRFFCIGALKTNHGFLNKIIEAREEDKPLTVRAYYERIGQDLSFEHYYRHPRNYDRRAVFSVDESAPVVTGVDRPKAPGYPGHPGDTAPVASVRHLSIRERARLQTFPDTFKFGGSKGAQNRMIGNAVPVKLAEFVGLCLLEYANG